MKKILWGSIPVLLLLQACSSQPDATTSAPATYTYTITADPQFTNLPTLQSFVLGTTADAWLFIGGRTNGFHAFPSTPDSTFPRKKANKWMYAYTLSTNTLDSMSVDSLPVDLRDQFSFTNIQHTQDGDSLYLCGGYGATYHAANDSTFITDSTFARIIVSQLVQAIKTHNKALVQSAIAYDRNPNVFVCATGGELLKINRRFYLVVGHRYQGAYFGNGATQTYLDGIHSFTTRETTTSIALDLSSFRVISDTIGGQRTDSTTQFHRRDLVVAPGIQTNGQTGISIYGGVFTPKNTTPFTHPIYVNIFDANAPFTVDPFNQYSNNYAAPILAMYAKSDSVMYTTIFGGIVENKNDSATASFTHKVLTLKHDLTANTTSDTVESVQLTTANNYYYGAESVFIPSRTTPMVDAAHSIIDFDALPANQPVVVGRIFGGILATVANNNTTTSSVATNQVFIITITKNTALVAK